MVVLTILKDLFADTNGNWCLIGDFNATLKDCERTGPHLANSRAVEVGF